MRASKRLLQVASTLPVPSAKPSRRPSVVHTIGVGAVALEIGDGRMDGVIRADTLIPARGGQLLQQVGHPLETRARIR